MDDSERREDAWVDRTEEIFKPRTDNWIVLNAHISQQEPVRKVNA